VSEKLTRRELCGDLATLALGGAWIASVGETPAIAASPTDADSASVQPACNFQASHATWNLPPHKDSRPYARHNTPHGNLARIQLEALVDVSDEMGGKTERYVLIVPCRTEWVYAKNRLFQLPSKEYRNVYSTTTQRGLGHGITYQGKQSRGRPINDHGRTLEIDVQTFAGTNLLRTPAQIVRATAQNVPLVARTEIRDPQTRRRYVLEYPVKTMNFQPKTDSFQVDTGPLLVPDFAANVTRPIDGLEMAHVAYNRLDRAEFILRRPTSVLDAGGKSLCEVLHFSEVREFSASTQIFGGESA